jgi:hypothetical protein
VLARQEAHDAQRGAIQEGERMSGGSYDYAYRHVEEFRDENAAIEAVLRNTRARFGGEK